MRVIEIHHGELIESSTNQGAEHAAIVAPHRHYRLPPGSTLVGHCSGRNRCFDGLVVATPADGSSGATRTTPPI
jgi:hypothetical protein